MANVKIKGNKATFYGSYTGKNEYSDVCYIEIEASKDMSIVEAESIVDKLEDDEFFYEQYKPEKIIDAMKKFIELTNAGWEEVSMKLHLEDKEKKGRTYMVITSHYGGREVSVSGGAVIEPARD